MVFIGVPEGRNFNGDERMPWHGEPRGKVQSGIYR